MKISLEWLSQYLPGTLDPHAAGDLLTNLGLPVEVFERHGNDTVMDVEVTSNRGDCLSHIGIARELSAMLKRPMASFSPVAKSVAVPVSSAVAVQIEAADLCPHYTAHLIKGVKIKPSPAWLVRRLEAVGLRSINNVVDVTNYVLFEMGQPLHAFDFGKLAGGRIIVRRAKVGEKLVSIDNKERVLTEGMLVIADSSGPVALAGVMGGRDTEVSEQTVDVLLESARFEPLSVRKTARALAMGSDSSYRFERGIDPTLPVRASLRAAQLILETGGGQLLDGIVEAGSDGYTAKKLTLRLARLRQVLGVDIPASEAIDALNRLGFSPSPAGSASGLASAPSSVAQIDVIVPSWRLDVNIEVDLIEEVARLVGYDRIPLRDEISIRLTPPDPALRAFEIVRNQLIAAGYFEAITVSFVSDLLADDFKSVDAASLPRTEPNVRAADARLRPSILPGLLEGIARNENNGTLGARLFETGSVFWADAAGSIIEHRRVALVGSTEVREVRGAVETLLTKLNADRAIRIVPDSRAGYAKDACGRVEWGGKAIGYLGKIDHSIAQKLSLREIPAAAELDLPVLLAGAQHVPQLKVLPRFPSVGRDLSLIVAESIRYEQIEQLVHALSLPHLESLEYVTTYRGKPLEKGQKSLTARLVFRSPGSTLTGEAVEAAVKQVIDAATARLSATLRV